MSEDWKRLYDDLNPEVLASLHAILEAEATSAKGVVRNFVVSRLNYVRGLLSGLQGSLPRCGRCIYFHPYQPGGERGWCEVGGLLEGEVRKNLLSLCPHFTARKSKEESVNE